jgi:DNA-binding NarL/FixJ family response regulator
VAADGTDSPIVEEALRTGGAQRCTLVLVSGAEEAENALSGGTQADVIFLRIAPGNDRRCSLSQIERLRSYKDEEHAPIVVFSECHDREFIEGVYEFPMTCYVQRADVREQYLAALRNAFDFWCSTAVLPRCNRHWQVAL